MRLCLTLCVLATSIATTVSCSTGGLSLEGKVLVDGAPLDRGTIRLDPVDSGSHEGAGGIVEDGVMRLSADHGLMAGKYRVAVTGFKRTGRKVNDPQRGTIDEMMPLVFANSPQEIEITNETASALTINFTTATSQ